MTHAEVHTVRKGDRVMVTRSQRTRTGWVYAGTVGKWHACRGDRVYIVVPVSSGDAVVELRLDGVSR